MIKSSPAYPLRMRGLKRKFWTYFLLCLATLNVTACDYIRPSQGKLDHPPFAKSGLLSVNQARDISTAAREEDGLSINAINLTKNKNMAESKGLLTTNRLFNREIFNDNERFMRLENAVQALADKIDSMAPSVTRLMDIDRDLDSLTRQLEILINGKSDFIQPTPAFQAVAKNKPQTVTPSTVPAHSGGLLKNIRIADHRGKTRIVFETSQKPNISVSLNNNERLMTVTLNHSNASLNLVRLAKKSKLIRNITQDIRNNKTIITFSLTKETVKIKEMHLPPNKDNASHRLFIDLKR